MCYAMTVILHPLNVNVKLVKIGYLIHLACLDLVLCMYGKILKIKIKLFKKVMLFCFVSVR